MKDFKEIIRKWISQEDFGKSIGLSKHAINKHLKRGIPARYAKDYAIATGGEITIEDVLNADKERRKKRK